MATDRTKLRRRSKSLYVPEVEVNVIFPMASASSKTNGTATLIGTFACKYSWKVIKALSGLCVPPSNAILARVLSTALVCSLLALISSVKSRVINWAPSDLTLVVISTVGPGLRTLRTV